MAIISTIGRRLREGMGLVVSRFSDNSAILLYHRVAESDRDPYGLCVSPSHFDEQMAAVSEIGTALPVGEFVARQRAGELPRHSICVTFDDGFLDVAENALPILERYSVPAAVYCVSGNVGGAFWWDRLIHRIYEPEDLPAAVEVEVEGQPVRVACSGFGRERVMREIHGMLSPMLAEERDHQLLSIGRQTGVLDDQGVPRTMTREELKALSAHPLMTIGAHTVSHSRLAALSPLRQMKEILSSACEITSITGEPVKTFSYPFGIWRRDYTSGTASAAASTGLDHALAADRGVVNRRTDPYRLPRIWMHDRSGAAIRKTIKRWL